MREICFDKKILGPMGIGWLQGWAILKFQIGSLGRDISLKRSLQDKGFDKYSFVFQWSLKETQGMTNVKLYHLLLWKCVGISEDWEICDISIWSLSTLVKKILCYLTLSYNICISNGKVVRGIYCQISHLKLYYYSLVLNSLNFS